MGKFWRGAAKLRMWAVALLTAGAAVSALAAAGSRPAGAELKNVSVYAANTFYLPIGTQITVTNTGSKCARLILAQDVTTNADPFFASSPSYIADNGGSIFHPCAYTRSDAQFDVRINLKAGTQYELDHVTYNVPHAVTFFAKINLIQIKDPNVFETEYLNHCYQSNITCRSGIDKIQLVYGEAVIRAPAWFGPLPSGPHPGAKLCSAEGSVCGVNGTQTVWFGANGRFVSRSVTGHVLCRVHDFGDPVPGVHKACWTA